MLMGNKDYFVANITCEVPLHPTIHGQMMAPLFEKSTIDSDMRTNPEKARREYFVNSLLTLEAMPLLEEELLHETKRLESHFFIMIQVIKSSSSHMILPEVVIIQLFLLVNYMNLNR